MNEFADRSKDPGEQAETTSAANRLSAIATDIRTWLEQSDDSMVYWLERATTRSGFRVDMHAAPIDISGRMRELLFQKVPSVIMASATVSTGREGGFQFFQSRIGATGSKTIQLVVPLIIRSRPS